MHTKHEHALTDDDDRGRDECADEEGKDEDADDDAEPLDEVHVRYLDRLRRPHTEDHRYPREVCRVINEVICSSYKGLTY